MSNDGLKEQILDSMQFSDYKRYYEQELGEIGKLNSSGWATAICPFHQDTKPSLNVNFFKEGAYRCMSCGETGDIFTFHQKKYGGDFKDALKYFADFLGLDIKKMKPKEKVKSKKTGTLDTVYQYKDINDNVVYETCKYKDPKDFRQRRPHPTKKNTYIWNLKDIKIIPYNLQSVIKNDTLYIVEGEKDADRLQQINLTATCNPMGAGKWPDILIPYFQNKTIIIIPDNDEPGKKHADLVAGKLKAIAKSIQIINLPNLQKGGDVSDWLNAGNTKADLLELIEKNKPYEDHIDFLNKKHAVIMLGGKCCILNEYIDPVFNRPTINFSNIIDLRNRYANKQIPNPLAGLRGQLKMINIVTDWMKSPDRRTYENIVFTPGKSPNGCYNLWKGFAVEAVQGDWSLFRNHIFKIIANGQQDIYEWIITWMARIVQDPGGQRPGTSLVLRGGQGTGKGCFFSGFGKIFGNHFMQINNQKQLTGQFNNHLKDVLFLFIDEGFWAGDKTSEGVIKGIITEDVLMIEPKGKDAVTLKNHINLGMASNDDWVVPSGLDERRFFTIDVSEDQKQNRQYFNALFSELKNGGTEAMLYDLLRWDLTTADIKTFKKTTAVFNQITETMSPVHKFWYEKLRNGELSSESDWMQKNESIMCFTLYAQYINFCNDLGVKRRRTNSHFGYDLKKICPQIDRKYIKTIINSAGEYKRKWYYEFPQLETCRELFEKIINIEIDWGKDSVFNNDLE
jgi:hypothetical protein